MLTEADRTRIAEAVARAESHTSVELRLVLAHRSSHYEAFALIYPAVLALVAGGIAAGLRPHLPAYVLFIGQAAIFIAAFALLHWQALRVALAPPAIRRRAAWRHARLQYASLGLTHPHVRNAALVFCSEAEHYVEILVDEEIAERLQESAWLPVLAEFRRSLADGRIADAFVGAAEACAIVLAPAFPALPGQANGLPDTLEEI
jgi:putative membrane protein